MSDKNPLDIIKPLVVTRGYKIVAEDVSHGDNYSAEDTFAMVDDENNLFDVNVSRGSNR